MDELPEVVETNPAQTGGITVLTPIQDVFAGSLAGLAGKILEYPMDTLKVRLQIQQLAAVRQFSGPWDCLVKTVRNEGAGALFRGMSLPLAGTMIENAILFGTNSQVKKAMQASKGRPLNMKEVLMAGGLSGFIISFVLTPIELVKSRLQAQGTAASSTHFTGPFDCIRKSVRAEGLKVLFRGHSGTLLREIPGTAGFFGAYEFSIRALSTTDVTKETPSPFSIVVGGAMGGMAYWLAFYPADTVKSAMQVQTTGPHSKQGFWGIFHDIYKAGGLRALYAGALPTVLRAIPGNIAVFMCYEYVSGLLRQL